MLRQDFWQHRFHLHFWFPLRRFILSLNYLLSLNILTFRLTRMLCAPCVWKQKQDEEETRSTAEADPSFI